MLTQNSRLVDERKAMGFTQGVMATALGISQEHLSRIENLRAIPSKSLMLEIADLLNNSVAYLFPYTLLSAIDAGVFQVRKAEVSPLHLSYLTDRANAGLLSDGGNGARAIEEEVDLGLLREKIDEVLQELTANQRRVLEMRFGLNDGKARTLEEVGSYFDVTRERIRQLENNALRRLRHPTRSRGLRKYLE